MKAYEGTLHPNLDSTDLPSSGLQIVESLFWKNPATRPKKVRRKGIDKGSHGTRKGKMSRLTTSKMSEMSSSRG